MLLHAVYSLVGALLIAAKPADAPFKLTADEQKAVDRTLERWEQWNASVQTFDCKFKRWTYDSVFGKPNVPMFVDFGSLKYAAPNQGVFRVEFTETDGKEAPIAENRAEYWIFDGKSVFECSAAKKQVIEMKAPPEFQGKNLVDGPMAWPFPHFLSRLFAPKDAKIESYPIPLAAKAETLRQAYYIRDVTPKDQKKQELIWLEAYPRSRTIAANAQRLVVNFRALVVIFRAKDMSPYALRFVSLTGKECWVYQFYEIRVNDPASQIDKNTFRPVVPKGWQSAPVTYPFAPPEASRPDNVKRK
jgi:TIGR03009 family protein